MSKLTQVTGLGMLVTNMLLLSLVIPTVSGHGRLYDPPGRSTMWRFGFDVPINYNDNELFCGGFAHQVAMGGLCGVCGDPWDGPRENEAGGKYATGIIARTYTIGQTIEVTIQLTANHYGYFEFRLCPHNNPDVAITHECLDRHLLSLADGNTRYYVTTAATGDYVIKVKLPDDIVCDQCVLQWRYHTGNSYGCDPDGTCCIGCGDQEEFYGCSDITIKGSPVDTTPGVSTGGTTPSVSTGGTTPGGNTGGTTPGGNTGSTGGDVSSTTPEPQPVECKASPAYADVPQVDEWCVTQCSAGYCPQTHCNEACLALMPQ